MYSHLHPTGKVYESHPKPVGIAFGGTTANERIFIDEDFARVTIRHHAMDKTYQHGSLIPNQVHKTNDGKVDNLVILQNSIKLLVNCSQVGVTLLNPNPHVMRIITILNCYCFFNMQRN